jgi:hypothetical protein
MHTNYSCHEHVRTRVQNAACNNAPGASATESDCGSFISCNVGAVIGPLLGVTFSVLFRILYLLVKDCTWSAHRVCARARGCVHGLSRRQRQHENYVASRLGLDFGWYRVRADHECAGRGPGS